MSDIQPIKFYENMGNRWVQNTVISNNNDNENMLADKINELIAELNKHTNSNLNEVHDTST